MLSLAKPLVIWTVAVLFVTMSIDIAAPLFSQVFVDGIITHKHPEWEEPLSLIIGLFLIISIANVAVGQYYKRVLRTKYQTRLKWQWNTISD